MIDVKLLIDPKSQISIRSQCLLLGIPRNSLSYKPVGETQESLAMMRMMDEHYMEHPSYGVLRMQDYLLNQGFIVNEKRVRRLLRLMGLMAIYPKINLSKLGQAKYIRPYLLRGLIIIRVNQVWAIDITYIPMSKGFLYLTAIIDHYSRYVVGWGLSNSLDASNSHIVLKEAILIYGKPEIINSDQGSQFTCEEWIKYLEHEEVLISMDGKGRAIDNIFIERLWRSVKYDYVYLMPTEDGMELFKGLHKYFNHYNNELRHQGIGRQIPGNVYRQITSC